MPIRKIPLIQNEVYHVFNKSIAGFKIYNTKVDYERMLETISFYMIDNPSLKFSAFKKQKRNIADCNPSLPNCSTRLVSILAYCFMPSHIHFILKELQEGGIRKFINLISMSYSKYFNLKHNRKGPLWEGRFKNILVATDEQLLHLTRYIHLNPVTAFLINDPTEWEYSSCKEYVGLADKDRRLCNFSDYIQMSSVAYEKFVKDQIGYQRELGLIKKLIIE